MDRDAIFSWLKLEFEPLTLATPDESIYQTIDNAIRYWNTNSGYKITEMYEASGASVSLSTKFKGVVEVFPATNVEAIWNNHPLWTLVGIQLLDNMTSDLILMSEGYRNYKYYLGKDFSWKVIKSEDPDNEGPELFLSNLPQGTSRIAVVGTKRIISDEDITSEHILDWILNYSKALLKIQEGNLLRKSGIIGVNNDGQELLNEGMDEKEKLKSELEKNGRWVAMARRF